MAIERPNMLIREQAACHFLSLAAALALAGCGSGSARILEQDGALWAAHGDRQERLAASAQYEKACDDDAVFYVFSDVSRDTFPLCVVECGRDGVLRRMHDYDNDAWHLANAIDGVVLLGQSRIFVDTHVNPSLGIGIDIDLDTRRTDVFYGTTFTWDRACKRLAYLREPPHFGSPADAPSKLMVGHEEICDVPRRLRSELFWNAGGDALAALVPPEDGRSGELVLVTLPDNAPRRVERFGLKPK